MGRGASRAGSGVKVMAQWGDGALCKVWWGLEGTRPRRQSGEWRKGCTAGRFAADGTSASWRCNASCGSGNGESGKWRSSNDWAVAGQLQPKGVDTLLFVCHTSRGVMQRMNVIPPVCAAANVVELKVPAGQTFSYEALKQALTEHKPKVLFLCQGESSTGTHQVGRGAAAEQGLSWGGGRS